MHSSQKRILRVPPMDVTNHPQCPPLDNHKGKKKIKKKKMEQAKRWRCDICQTKFFSSFDEACAHEEICKQVQQVSQPPAMATKPQQAPANSFFAPRKSAKSQQQSSFVQPNAKKPKTETIVIEDSPPKAKEVCDITPCQETNGAIGNGEVQFLKSKTVPRKKKRLAPVDQPISVDNAQEMANTLAALIDDKLCSKPLAGLFSSKPSKQLLAEQRQAEFQAKRRLERQKELERQQKRQARTKLPTAVAAASAETMKLADKPTLPLAPRFPVPSHVMPSSDTTAHHVQVSPPIGWLSSAVSKSCSNQVTKKLIASPSVLDTSTEEGNEIQNALHDVLVPPSSSNQDDGLLFVDKYATPLVGTATAERRLQTWIQKWCRARETAMERMMERQRKLRKQKRKRKIQYKEEDDDDLWQDDESRLGSLFLLTGPPSSGKTALVHSVAAQCQCPVLEINTTQARGGASLKNAIQEATQSCSSLDLIQRQSKKLDAFGDDDDDEKASSLTVILIDEVDCLFADNGDAGFWNGLSSVAKTAKCPIFLTANAVPRHMKFLLQHLELERPQTEDCRAKLLQVCRQEGISTKPELDAKSVKERLARVAEACDCDVRRMLHEVQSFVHSTPTANALAAVNMDSTRIPWNNAFSACSNGKLPKLLSLKRARVVAENYSVVTVMGKNFGFLQESKYSWDLMIGQRSCKAHVVDEETLLVLCPPRQDLIAERLSLRFTSGWVLNGDHVETDELPGTSQLPGKQPLYVHYHAAEKERESDSSDDKECEFESGSTSEDKGKEARGEETSKECVEEEGIRMWKAVVANAGTVQCSPHITSTSQKDREHLATLKSLASDTQLLSDAALLEDMQFGLPHLSGACMGFGFDMTGSNQGDAGKLKMHDKIRPPREDRLFDLGWKDNCYFFGDSETYVTLPATAHERRLINTEMTMARRKWNYEAELPSNDNTDDTEEAGDAEEVPCPHMPQRSDDVFLPRQVSALILSLPSLLRERAGDVLPGGDFGNSRLLCKKRSKRFKESRTLVSYMGALSFRNIQPRMIEPFQDNSSREFFLELLPMLRRLAYLERDSERIEAQPAEDPYARTTRHRSRKGRKHLFEKLAFVTNEEELSASKAGERFAKSFLIY